MTDDKKQVSIYDIAKMVGVSAATVSNVLNGKGHASEKTRAAVLETARREGYVVNLAAKGLKSSRSHSIGIITPDVSNDYYSNIVLHVESLMHEQGYTSYICNTANNAERAQEYAQDMIQRNIDAFVFIGGRGGESAALIGSTPSVFIDHLIEDRPSRSFEVGNDTRQMTYDQTRLLVDRGCRRIVFLMVDGSGRSIEGQDKYKGYVAALSDAGIKLDKNLVAVGDHSKSSRDRASELVRELVRGHESFDGIVAIGDRLAMGAAEELRRNQISVGNAVKIVGLDNSLYSEIYHPQLSTVDRGTDRMARIATSALKGMLQGKDPKSSSVLISHRIIERESTLGNPPMA